MAFPLGFAELKVYGQAEEAEGRQLVALIETSDNGQTFDAAVVDEEGIVYLTLRGYRTITRPGTAE